MAKDDLLVLKALADESRLKIMDALLQEDLYVEALSEMLDLKPPTVSHHLKKLMKAGLVTSQKDQYYTVFQVNRELLNRRLLSFVSLQEDQQESQRMKLAAYEERVCSNFFKYGRLVRLPVQLKKRLIILSKIIESFDHGLIYTEKEVNEILLTYYEDYCTLRRDLVANKLLRRENNTYWREL